MRSGCVCHTLSLFARAVQDMRVVFVDGTVLDTADPASCEAFMKVGINAARQSARNGNLGMGWAYMGAGTRHWSGVGGFWQQQGWEATCRTGHHWAR